MIAEGRLSRKTSLVLLFLLAAATAAAWRAEVAWHAGTHWARYFHWSIPFSIVLLSLWAATVNRSIGPRRQLWLGLLLVLVSCLCVALVELALSNLYRGGLVLFEKSWFRRLGDLISIAALMIIPLYYASAAWMAGLEVTGARVAASLGLFWAALPAALVAAGLLSDGWGLAGAIRGGYAIPPVILALGLPLLPPSSRRGGAAKGAMSQGPFLPDGRS